MHHSKQLSRVCFINKSIITTIAVKLWEDKGDSLQLLTSEFRSIKLLKSQHICWWAVEGKIKRIFSSSPLLFLVFVTGNTAYTDFGLVSCIIHRAILVLALAQGHHLQLSYEYTFLYSHCELWCWGNSLMRRAQCLNFIMIIVCIHVIH